jgi:hypothetical protein
MIDISDDAVYLSAAFEPTEAELEKLEQERRHRKSKKPTTNILRKPKSSPVRDIKPKSIMDLDLTLSDSDDDMPDLSVMLAKSNVKTGKCPYSSIKQRN